ncbi:MAG: NAD(P)H-dependent oxidoreductase subunit E [Clostridia bacterium]|nr:NAD(P)H-dependent oxidoreductase subunit E [Clostridia bacterium]MBQ4586753.1 NAD(P)H-dependent oxidoreductase subunit E [Clostridia bacterium]MBQ6882934.1 NAD(P)H-dependent oxidoreductase subunit E [Clostridia bacterium]MBR2932867.1 NAD(P)H-dependent oxidoreductase subunit E [Clostridia bacterium]MBR6687307.1 NAD(P)H-dependent oxidoreductase subunit E [Clostridia bacterium]
MLIVQICVGSSCHLKGSQEIVELLQNAVEEFHLEDEVVLTGSFCIGKCNRVGVTVQINDDVHVGVTRENFREFFKKNILDVIQNQRN